MRQLSMHRCGAACPKNVSNHGSRQPPLALGAQSLGRSRGGKFACHCILFITSPFFGLFTFSKTRENNF